MEQKAMTIALFREKLLLDYRTPLKILAHLSLEFAVSPLVVRLAGIEPDSSPPLHRCIKDSLCSTTL
jgi:hypothetical protein